MYINFTCIRGAIIPVLTSPTSGWRISRNANIWHTPIGITALSYASFIFSATKSNILYFLCLSYEFIIYMDKSKELQNNNSDTYFIAYKIKTNYFMTKQIVWTFRKFFFLQFNTKFASKQQRLAKIGTIFDCCCQPRFRKFDIPHNKIRGRKGQYYQPHIPRSWPLLTTAHFATKGGLIQIQTGMHWWRKWMENHF